MNYTREIAQAELQEISEEYNKAHQVRMFEKHYPDLLQYLQEIYGNLAPSELFYLGKTGFLQEDFICQYGNLPNFLGIVRGYTTFCGKRDSCECNRLDSQNTQTNKTPEQRKATDDLRKANSLEEHGVDHPMKVPEIADRVSQALLNKTDEEWAERDRKSKATKLAEHGDENYINVELRKETMLERHGHEHALQVEEFNNKRKETNLELFGNEEYTATAEFKQRTEQFWLETEGVTNAFQAESVKKKIKDYWLETEGVENPMQVPEIAEKSFLNAHEWKEYNFPSGRTEKVQGYEPLALDFLLETVNEDDIVVRKTQMPNIKWFDKSGKTHQYRPDIMVKLMGGIIVEVKSGYTYLLEKDETDRKLQATTDAGLTAVLMIFRNERDKTPEIRVI